MNERDTPSGSVAAKAFTFRQRVEGSLSRSQTRLRQEYWQGGKKETIGN